MHKPKSGEIALLQTGPNAVRQAVVKRDDDILTAEQIKQHWPEIQKAMIKELQTWAKLKCFSRRPRQGTRNIIDVRWVIKFKWETPTKVKPRNGGRPAQAPQPIRTIRARLIVRGFKDSERGDIDRYAGTCTKCSQKLIVSEAVRKRLADMCYRHFESFPAGCLL